MTQEHAQDDTAPENAHNVKASPKMSGTQKKLLTAALVAGTALTSCTKDKTIITDPGNPNNPNNPNYPVPVDTSYPAPNGVDTVVVTRGDTSLVRWVSMEVGAFAQSNHDPLGSELDAMKPFGFIAVPLGYYDIASNPVGRTRSPLPANAGGKLDVSNISPGDGYQTNLYNTINSIPNGFVTQSLYPGYNMPNYKDAAVRAAMTAYFATAGLETKGVMLTQLNNITAVAKANNDQALLEAALQTFADVSTQLKAHGKKLIIGDCFDMLHDAAGNVLVNVPQRVGQLTDELSFTVFTVDPEIPALQKAYYAKGLSSAMIGANKDITVYPTVNSPDNKPTNMKNYSAQIKEVGALARTGNKTVHFKGFFVKDFSCTDPSDLIANRVITGYVKADGEKPHIPTDHELLEQGIVRVNDRNDIAWHNPHTRTFDKPHQHVNDVTEHEPLVANEKTHHMINRLHKASDTHEARLTAKLEQEAATQTQLG